jgi:hypothetical protein
MASLECPHALRRTTVDQATAGVYVRQDDGALRIQHLSRLCHKFDPTESNHVAIELLRDARKFEAVSNVIGNLLNLRILVMMRQNRGAPARLQLFNLFGNRG